MIKAKGDSTPHIYMQQRNKWIVREGTFPVEKDLADSLLFWLSFPYVEMTES